MVRDSNGCFAFSNQVEVTENGPIVINANHTQINCAETGTSTLTITPTGGTAPYQYSLDGVTFQTSNNFTNLPAGFYDITVRDASGNANTTYCETTLAYEIDQPFRLRASAVITQDASCDPNGALVKIVNPTGGQPAYEFSFDGGTTFSANDTNYLLPGDYNFIVRDALGCEFPIDFTVPGTTTIPSFTPEINYLCDGSGEITINPANTTDYTYSYAINGVPNSL